MKNIKLLAIINTLGLILALVLNGLANALPINGKTTGELSDAYPNLFVPTGFTFAIWGVIYLTLFVFIVYQLIQAFSKGGNAQDFLPKISWFFLLSCIANASWIVAWHYQYLIVSLVIMLCILFTLIMIYQRLEIGLKSVPTAQKWLVHIPFSIYLGWITVATIANTTALLVDLGWNGFSISPEIWTVIVLIVGTLIGLTMTQKRNEIAYGLVIIWAYYGIVFKRMDLGADLYNSIVMTAIIGMVLITFAIIRNLRKI
ncbi:MAG: hypothetical protein ACJAUH_002667 [Saprospiraceae bacterium]|jgi:hypothetical protein|tara:strand:- start:1230 stop:2003 length:774 start_codon:yes stop_codon:yes gene_type:complete